jgi:hypothetical protein
MVPKCMLGIKERVEGRTKKGVENLRSFANSVTKWLSALWTSRKELRSVRL